jgi:hypothetical protein
MYLCNWWKCSHCLSPDYRGRSSGSYSSLISLSSTLLKSGSFLLLKSIVMHHITSSQNISLQKFYSCSCVAFQTQETQSSFVTIQDFVHKCLNIFYSECIVLCNFGLCLSPYHFDWAVLVMIRGKRITSWPFWIAIWSSLYSYQVLFCSTHLTLGWFLENHTLHHAFIANLWFHLCVPLSGSLSITTEW